MSKSHLLVPGDVDVLPSGRALARLVGHAGARVEVIGADTLAVQRKVEDVGVGVREVLGAVAVVYVPVDDEDLPCPLPAVLRQC